MNIKYLSFIAVGFVLVASSSVANTPGGGPETGAPDVTLTDNGTTVTLANGTLTAVVTKDNAKINSILFNGTELVNQGGDIYYSMDGSSSYRQPSGCSYTVITNTPDMVDIGMRQTWSTQAQPLDIEIHYVLRRGDSGIYTYALLDHPAAYPAGGYGEWRMVWKLPSDTFERLYVDADDTSLRNRQMPNSYDYANATATAIAEILHLNTGVLAGQDEGKYCYNAEYSTHPVYGHATDNENIGVWLVFGAQEWFNDGPFKQDLAPAYQILHVHFGMNHYNGPGASLDAGEDWRKLYGPFLLYCNAQPAGADACWADAQAQVQAESDAWPYDWLTSNTNYPTAAQRATVSGTIHLTDSLKPALDAEGAWVGLAQPDAGGNFQFESKGYQHWVKAGAGGSFTIPHVRPGTYTLYCVADGETGEFEYSNPVAVSAGQTLDLGILNWNIARLGTWLAWEIGLPDRDSREFRHGDDYWVPFIYERFDSEFPNPLSYDVSSSEPSTDWNFAQPGYNDGTNAIAAWPWNVNFNLPSVPASGTARLYLAFAGSHYARMYVSVNGSNPIGGTGFFYPNNSGGNALLRQSSHAKYACHTVDIPVSMLQNGANTITITQGKVDTSGAHVMYDYVGLEMPSLAGGNPSDGDGDGLPDAWELQYFRTLSQIPSGDYDHDLSSNGDEWAAGSDPADPQSIADADHDLLPDGWERMYYGSITNVAPLDDSDGDGFNAWIEYRSATSPTNNASYPVQATTNTVTTADGAGLDGSLCEVDYSAAYDGGFYTDDARNFTYQITGLRHYMTVFKFDLSSIDPAEVLDATLRLTLNASTGGSRTRTLAAFTGDDALITPSIGYNAANPFIDDAYTPETDTDTDFAAGTTENLLGFASSTGEGTVEEIGTGQTSLSTAVQNALDGDGFLTLILYGGNTQYLTYGDENPTVSKRPTLVLSLAVSGSVNADEDGDSLEDAWEAQYFGTLARGANDDLDGDGTPEWLEEKLGLDPNDANQTYRNFLSYSNASFTLNWLNATGVVFTVESTTNLTAPWTTNATIYGTEIPATYSFPLTTDGDQTFYRTTADHN